MRAALVALVGFALFVVILLAFWFASLHRPARDQTSLPSAAATTAKGRRIDRGGEKPDRVIDPGKFAPLFGEDAHLERAAPRAPLSKLARPRRPHEDDAGLTLLYRPVAVAAGVFRTKAGTIRLKGIHPLAADETCVAASGERWPCGTFARTALRRFMRGRAIRCDLQSKTAVAATAVAENSPVVTTCMLAGDDIAGWLVSHGWARAAKGGLYGDLEKAARDAGLGIFGKPPSY